MGDTKDREGSLGRLHSELARIAAATYPVRLKVSADASKREIRVAFLAVVRDFHPHRFAHLGGDCERVANEIFLAAKEAHDEMLVAAANVVPSNIKKRKRRTSAPSEPAGRKSSVRFRSGKAKSSPVKRAEAGDKTAPMRPLVVPVSGPAPGDAEPVEPRAAKKRRPARVKRRDDKSPPAVDNGEPPPADHSGLVAMLASQEESKLSAYREATKLLRKGRAAEAREAFRGLAVANPSDKRYRTHMHFAWGREHELAGRVEQASTEYQRALNVTPTFTPALEALETLSAVAERPGVFGRLFRGRQK